MKMLLPVLHQLNQLLRRGMLQQRSPNEFLMRCACYTSCRYYVLAKDSIIAISIFHLMPRKSGQLTLTRRLKRQRVAAAAKVTEEVRTSCGEQICTYELGIHF